jgi:hypothetical protein
MRSSNSSRPETLWAITSYFNPLRYRRRLSNFRIFREHLQLPLVAVELAYGSEFELRDQDAEIVVRLRGGAVLWQKERLLNLALRALPNECEKVAWLDCDIVFESSDWHQIARSLLDRFPIIQLFRQAHYLAPQGEGDRLSPVEFTRQSAASTLASGGPAAASLGHLIADRKVTPANGLAWAARRELLDRHGFFDACIIGGGDRAMISAAHRCFDQVVRRQCMNKRQRERYIAWAEPFYDSVRADAGFIDGDILHLWHGDIRERYTLARYEGFQQFQFDPFTDVAIEENGSWRWDSDKPDMHDYVCRYFASRKEDGYVGSWMVG